MDAHYVGIIAGYAAAAIVIWTLSVFARSWVSAVEPLAFKRPWLQIGIVIIAVAATIGVGQLYVRNLLAPDEGVALRTLNQALIFAPLLLAAFLLPPGARGAGLPLGRASAGLPIGVVAGAGALALYVLVRGFAPADVFEHVLQVSHIPHAAQVLFEDVAIAALLLRLRAVVGTAWSVILVAALFAAGHIPAMLANGVGFGEMATLLLDTGIGVLVVSAILATRSIWWFWPIHTAMDLTQFFAPG